MDGAAAPQSDKPPLDLLIAAPRGFCAGVDRAIRIVELSIEKFGAPVYVRHEIVHNRHVVDVLKSKGAIFVEELDEVPDGVPVVFSAHGVPKIVLHKAAERGLDYIDATCPLVSKVHRQAERLIEAGKHIVFIGHRGHPEVVGTFGQIPPGTMTLIETNADAEAVAPAAPSMLAFLTQTTLSVDDTAQMIATLKRRFPMIEGPRGEDICYATSNRQLAIKTIAAQSDAILVLGAPNSSNSVRLVEVAERAGKRARLIESARELDLGWLEGVRTLGISAGASAPEILVRELIEILSRHFELHEREIDGPKEVMTFKLPRAVVAA